ncbi:MAG: SufE family protein [Ignavibacteria bacterium]|nr:SufE family protein [Ignavibacteria bacterium]
MTIKEIEKEIIDEFLMFEEWDEKYEYIIELGKKLSLIDRKFKTDNYKVTGCQSQVWVKPEFENGVVTFQADSDAIITKGLIALLIRVLSGHKPEEIADAELTFLNEIGLKEHLSPTRSNGLISMIARMKTEAKKYSSIN